MTTVAQTSSLVVASADPSRDKNRCRTHRAHRARRTRRVTVAYDDEEFDAVVTAATAAGLTPTGYVAQAAVAAAIGQSPPMSEPLREALAELIAARAQVRRFGVNVNQAVRELNSTGTPPEWLHNAVAITTRAVARLDATTAELARQIRWSLPRTGEGI